MKIILNTLSVLEIERIIHLFPWFSDSPGKTDTLEKNTTEFWL